MHQAKNDIIFLFEQVDSYSVTELRSGMGKLYDVFLESGYIFQSNGFMKFTYTGIAADANSVFCILPKYLKGNITSDAQYLDKAKELLKVLKAYQHKVDLSIEGADLINYSSDAPSSEISLADFILSDYLQHGIWSIVKKNVVLNTDNETLWEYTIDNSYPVISKYPYYFDIYSTENESINNTVISRIHEWAVSHCAFKYGDLLDIYTDLDQELVPALDDIGDKAFLLGVIERELRITFIEKDITLLKALSELISASNQYGEDNYTLYGQNKFEHVWEAAVGHCFKNQYYSLKKYLSAPVWQNHSGSILSEKHTVKPDVIRWIRRSEKSSMLTIDAKYYLYKFNDINNKAENNPGVGDIIKQYFYEFILKRAGSGAEWLNYDTEYINILAFPKCFTNNDSYSLQGSVSIDNSATDKPIVNMYLNADLLFRYFYQGRVFSDQLISGMIAEINQS